MSDHLNPSIRLDILRAIASHDKSHSSSYGEPSFIQRLWLASTEYVRYILGFMAIALVCMSFMSPGVSGSADEMLWHVCTLVALTVLCGLELYRIIQGLLLRRMLEQIVRHDVAGSSPAGSSSRPIG